MEGGGCRGGENRDCVSESGVRRGLVHDAPRSSRVEQVEFRCIRPKVVRERRGW